MRTRFLVVITAVVFLTPGFVEAQQATAVTATPQAATLLSQSAAALAGPVAISDITLNGNVQRIVSVDDESGTAVLTAMTAGESSVVLALPNGNLTETRSFDSNGNVIGWWSGPDAVQHTIPFHNLQTDSSWFFPAMTLTRLVNAQGLVATYVDQETLNGESVYHVTVSQPPSAASTTAPTFFQHLTQMDLYLDTTTLLPAALAYSTHADADASLNIPVQILFSNYQTVSGVKTPFQIQEFLNGSLLLNIQLQSATLNSGISASAFGTPTPSAQ